MNNKYSEKRWELLMGVHKGIEDLLQYPNFIDVEEVKMLLESLEKMRLLKDNIYNQEKELKLRLLVSSRERNVYLEKLRKTEEFGEKNNWKDHSDVFFPQLNDLLYKDNASPGLSNVPSGNIIEKK